MGRKETHSVSTSRVDQSDGRGPLGFLVFSAVAWLSSFPSCTLVTNLSKDQCSVTADCLAKGDAFADTYCAHGVCVAKESKTAVTADRGCTSNADCLGRPESADTYCSAAGTCLPILSQDCASIVTSDGGPIPPDALVLGVLAPLSGDNAPDGRARVQAATLAYREFLQFAVGIPSGPTTKPRSAALVVCDQIVDPERAATHLAVNVKVPAIIGPGFSGTTIKVAKNVTIPSGVLLMSPSATTPDLTSLQDNGLVWRTAGSFQPEAQAYTMLIAQMEASASVRSRVGLASGAALRLAILAKGDSYGKGLAELLMGSLRFNGTDVPGNGSNFARFDLPDFSVNPNADASTIVQSIVNDFKPHLILATGTAEVITKGMAPIEEQWITGTGAQPRPFFLVSEGAKLTDLVNLVSTSQSSHPDRAIQDRIRVFGPAYNETLSRALSARYQAAFGEPLPDTYGVAGSYDAFYLLVYALTATQTEPPTGASIAKGLHFLVPPGERVAAGPSDISKAIAALSAGRNVDYDGVVGPLDFDVNTGDAPSNYNLYCVKPSGFDLTGQYYDTRQSALVGTYGDCP